MNFHSHNFRPQDVLVATSFEFRDRSFCVTVRHDGWSYWLDEEPKTDAIRANPELQFMALAGEERSRQFLRYLESEFTLKAIVPENVLHIIRDELSPEFWKDELNTKDFDEKLDAMLEPLFWEQINPQLTSPIDRQI